MSWPNLVETGIFSAGSFLGAGVVAVIEGLFRKPSDLVKLWMASNDQLLVSNRKLEKSLDRSHRSNYELQTAMFATRRVLMALVDAVETKDEKRLMAALERARALNNGH